MPETACFLFVESEVDKRGKLYKAVKEKGRIVEMTRQDGATLQKWVLSMIQKERKADHAVRGPVLSHQGR